ncbi:MAG: hypothetical protein NC117_02710 [Pseudoflavonifractor sp.]|nr:hypothetical protein [Pseudoflavonifractor sp.]
MRRVEIMIDGTAYPCSPTMGAMLRFKQETGREITEMDSKSFTDLCTYLWCCVKSASRREGREFDMSLMDFADSISPDDMTAWGDLISRERHADGDEVAGDEKKTPPASTTS